MLALGGKISRHIKLKLIKLASTQCVILNILLETNLTGLKIPCIYIEKYCHL